VTAHLVHLGWFHLWLNLAALAVIALLFEGVLSAGDWLAAFAVSAAGIDVGLYLDQPAVQWYVGLSGVLHGIVAFGALRLAVARSPIGVLLCVGLAAKLGWEHWVGPLPFSAESTGGAVLSQAHVYGTFAGASLGLAGAAGRRLRRRRL
jgi:rhomboid family GlyGly-CTERM serine protease